MKNIRRLALIGALGVSLALGINTSSAQTPTPLKEKTGIESLLERYPFFDVFKNTHITNIITYDCDPDNFGDITVRYDQNNQRIIFGDENQGICPNGKSISFVYATIENQEQPIAILYHDDATMHVFNGITPETSYAILPQDSTKLEWAKSILKDKKSE